MKKITKTVTKREAYGKKLDKPITFDFSYNAYTDEQEIVTARDEMNLREQMKARNVAAKLKARQAAETAALDAAGIEKPNAENDPQFRLREMFKTLMTSKLYTEAQARTLAAEMLKVEWTDSDDDE